MVMLGLVILDQRDVAQLDEDKRLGQDEAVSGFGLLKPAGERLLHDSPTLALIMPQVFHEPRIVMMKI